MSNQFYDNEFEKYLKEKANQYRMYPSDHAWRNIQNEIHGYRKWPALTFLSIFIISALVVGTVLVKPHTQLATLLPNRVDIKNIGKGTPPNINVDSRKNYVDHLAVENITQQTINKAIETVQTKRRPEAPIDIAPVHPQTTINSAFAKNVGVSQTLAVPANKMLQVKNTESTLPDNNSSKTTFVYSSMLRRNLNADAPLSKNYFNLNLSFANHAQSIESNDVDSRFNFILSNPPRNTSSSFLKFNSNSSRFDFQFYVTPSISYRRLIDDAQGKLSRSYITALPFAANYMVDVNRVIRHTSSAGYEIGLSLGYNLNTKFALRSGFQFNMREYDIDAYVHPVEPATIALVNRSSSDIYNTVTGFRNTAGSSPIVLKNRYYEISLPIGIDWRPVNDKFSWGIATSIQPTYTFDKEPFVITSNFKNYADGSQLMRNWNLNASFETYLGYNTGRYRWQIGPQIRYQLLPTMTNSYPIREYLVDYGIKLGLTRSLK